MSEAPTKFTKANIESVHSNKGKMIPELGKALHPERPLIASRLPGDQDDGLWHGTLQLVESPGDVESVSLADLGFEPDDREAEKAAEDELFESGEDSEDL